MTKTLEELQGEGDNFLNFYVSAEILNNPLQKKLCEEAYSAITENLFKAGQLSGVEMAMEESIKTLREPRELKVETSPEIYCDRRIVAHDVGYSRGIKKVITNLTALQGELKK